MNDQTQLFGDVGFHGLHVADVKQAAVVRVSLELLRDVLGFPRDVRIAAVKEGRGLAQSDAAAPHRRPAA